MLVPRPDTETLIEEALRVVPDRTRRCKIADLGTGSGAILIAALKEFPNATGIGFESAPRRLCLCRRQRGTADGDRAEIRLADWDQAEGPFDLVFSNPPYIAALEIESLEPEVSRFEPRAALDGGDDGLAAYRRAGGTSAGHARAGRPRFAGNRLRPGPDMSKLCSPSLKFCGSHPTCRAFPAASSYVKPEDFLGKTRGFG